MRIPAVIPTLFCIVALAAAPASAQKTQKSEKPKPAPVAAPQVTMKDLLAKYEGKSTNLGKLTKVTAEYFVLEQDGTVSMHPLSVLHTIRLVKDEETNEQAVELVLVAGD